MDTANTIAVALNLLLYCIHVALVMNTMIIALCLNISLFVYIVLTNNDNTIHTTKQQTLYYVLLVVTIICFHCVLCYHVAIFIEYFVLTCNDITSHLLCILLFFPTTLLT